MQIKGQMNKVPQGLLKWSENPENDFPPRNHLCLSHSGQKFFLGVPHIYWILVPPFLNLNETRPLMIPSKKKKLVPPKIKVLSKIEYLLGMEMIFWTLKTSKLVMMNEVNFIHAPEVLLAG